MQAADTRQVERQIRRALANESATTLWIERQGPNPPPLTANDARRIIACLENPRFDTLDIDNYSLHNDAVLNVFRDGLPLCTAVKTVKLQRANLGNEDLDRLRSAFYNTSIRTVILYRNNIQGQRGGELIRDLLVGNNTLRELNLCCNPIDHEGARDPGQGIAVNNRLEILVLNHCEIGNDFLANFLLPADGKINNSLLHLDISRNNIEGAEGGRQVSLLLQRCPALKVLRLDNNKLGPLGAIALAPGLAAASRLESLGLHRCELGNDGVANLIPDGQENRSLTSLDLGWDNNIQGLDGGENIVTLASHCTNLDRITVNDNALSPDQQHRLDLLLDRKRLCTEASTLGGSTFPVLFRFMENAHRHEHGLGAIVVILQNDGDDYFCTALNCAME